MTTPTTIATGNETAGTPASDNSAVTNPTTTDTTTNNTTNNTSTDTTGAQTASAASNQVVADETTTATAAKQSLMMSRALVAEPKSIATVDQLDGKYVDDDGNVSDIALAVNAGDASAATSTTIPTDITDVFNGQTDSKVTANKDIFGQLYTDPATGKQWIQLLTDKVTNTATSYSFGNQIDTTQSFEIQGELSLDKLNGGGGIGIILQPVNPSEAGIGAGASASADIGIIGQKDTTFIGFDNYQSGQPGYNDTPNGSLTIRQTDGTGTPDGSAFVQMNMDKANSTSDVTNPAGTNPHTAQVNGKAYDVLFDYKWTPDTGTVVDGKVTGTITATVTDVTNGAVKKLTVTSVQLNQAESVAMFAAAGSGGANYLGRINSFTLTKVTEPTTVNYINVKRVRCFKLQRQLIPTLGAI
ncbi:lectin-like domain-containing protein [Secundilactobacillus similis]|uniref:lectin-like domain-containing protein n=1 Tax=Secundilactobacillus similis TaxID=414682 RepID=UPI0006D1F8E5|nr:hypothetical protein [Secundilactobacillus similis]